MILLCMARREAASYFYINFLSNTVSLVSCLFIFFAVAVVRARIEQFISKIIADSVRSGVLASGFNEIHCIFQLSASTNFCDFTIIYRNNTRENMLPASLCFSSTIYLSL